MRLKKFFNYLFTYTPGIKLSDEEFIRKIRLSEEERLASENHAWKMLETELQLLALEKIPRRKRNVIDDNEINDELIQSIGIDFEQDEEIKQQYSHQRQRSYSDTETNLIQFLSKKSIDNHNRRQKGRRKSIKRKKSLKLNEKIKGKLSLEYESPSPQKKISFSKGPSYDHISSRLFQPTTSFLQHVHCGRELQHSISLSNENNLFKVHHTTPSLTGEISRTTEPLAKEINENHNINFYPSTHSSGGTRGRKVNRKSRTSKQSRSISHESNNSYNSIDTDYLSDSSCLWTDNESASVSSLPILLPTYLQSQDSFIEKMRPNIIQNLLRNSSSSSPHNSDSDNSVDINLR